MRVVGDLQDIQELAASCRHMTHGTSFTLTDLSYGDVVAKLPEEGSHTCELKFRGPELQHNLAAWPRLDGGRVCAEVVEGFDFRALDLGSRTCGGKEQKGGCLNPKPQTLNPKP